MNDQPPFSLLPAPMQKEKVAKEDGRFLYYYSFEEAPPPPTSGELADTPEDTDV